VAVVYQQVVDAGCPLNPYNGVKGGGCTPLVLASSRGNTKVRCCCCCTLSSSLWRHFTHRAIAIGSSAMMNLHSSLTAVSFAVGWNCS
jgi:hypothetical protein